MSETLTELGYLSLERCGGRFPSLFKTIEPFSAVCTRGLSRM